MILVQELRLFPLTFINWWPKYGIRVAVEADPTARACNAAAAVERIPLRLLP
jgi:hypothetical protein